MRVSNNLVASNNLKLTHCEVSSKCAHHRPLETLQETGILFGSIFPPGWPSTMTWLLGPPLLTTNSFQILGMNLFSQLQLMAFHRRVIITSMWRSNGKHKASMQGVRKRKYEWSELTCAVNFGRGACSLRSKMRIRWMTDALLGN